MGWPERVLLLVLVGVIVGALAALWSIVESTGGVAWGAPL
jgi:hypothetical protein